MYLKSVKVQVVISHLSKPQSESQTILYLTVANDFSPWRSQWFFLGKVKQWQDEVFIVIINSRNVEK